VARDLFADREQAARELAALADKELNFDAEAVRSDPPAGWRIDDYRQALPREEAGPPAAEGSWVAACRILRDYDFIDPSIVRAAFRPDDALDGRDLLLELRVWGLRFHVGVRVVGVTDATVVEDGREAVRWGWSYATLDGHFEAGQMDYEVRKWTDTGEVEFRIHAFSRVTHIPNPVVRLGFRVLGRRKQTQFARRACERLRVRTKRELARAGGGEVARASRGGSARGRARLDWGPDDGLALRPTW
jgi:uncharacterized protein (UPF0548 family)